MNPWGSFCNNVSIQHQKQFCWAWHVTSFTENRWTCAVVKWYPRDHKQPMGRWNCQAIRAIMDNRKNKNKMDVHCDQPCGKHLATWPIKDILAHWSCGLSVRQRSGRSGFNPRLCHTKDFKNGTWYLLA